MKHISQKIISYVIIIVAIIGLNYVSATAWVTPPTPVLTANTDTPLTVDVFDQIKQGSLSVGAFLANQDAEFDGQTFLTGVARGRNGAALTIGNDTVVSGKLIAASFVQSDTLAKNGNNKPLCVDANGTIYVCVVPPGTVIPPVDICPNIPGDQSVMPTGLAQADSGDCLGVPSVTSVSVNPTYKTVQVQKATSTVVSGRSIVIQLSGLLISNTTFYYQATIRGSDYKGGWGTSYGVVNIPLSGAAGQATVSGNLIFPDGKNNVLSYCIGRELPTTNPDNKGVLDSSYQKNKCDPTAPTAGGSAGIGCDPANPTVPPSSIAPWWQCTQ